MPIIVYKEYTATRTGTAIRNETCEKCHGQFAYEVQATVRGSGSSPFFLTNAKAQRDAERRAEAHLEDALQYMRPMVACPHCGWYQSAMVKAMLAPRMRWMRFFAWVALLGGSFVVFMLHVDFSHHGGKPQYAERPYIIGTEIVLFLLWFCVLSLRAMLVARRDPNRNWVAPSKEPHRPAE